MAEVNECERFVRGAGGAIGSNSGVVSSGLGGDLPATPSGRHPCAAAGCIMMVATPKKLWCRSCAARQRRKPMKMRNFPTVGSILHWAWGLVRGRRT